MFKMSAIRCHYSRLPGFPKSPLMPTIEVNLISGKSQFPTRALVDSGASQSAITTEVAEFLGIDWNSLPSFTGFSIQGAYGCHPYPLKIEILGQNFTFTFNIIEGRSIFSCVLGQEDFFKMARVVFERYREVFEISFKGRKSN